MRTLITPPRAQPVRSPHDTASPFLAAQGEMAAKIRGFDWTANPLGPVEDWPEALRAVVTLMLDSGHPMLVWWGDERIQIFNDAHAPSWDAARHPAPLGQPGKSCWPEGWHILEPQLARIFELGRASWHEQHPLPITRAGRTETTHWTYSLNAVPLPERAKIGGVLMICEDTTKTVQALRNAEQRVAAQSELLREHLARSENLRALLDGTERLVLRLDGQGRVRHLNRAAAGWLGAEIRGKILWETSWAAPMEVLLRADFSRAAAGAVTSSEVSLNLPAGRRSFVFSMRRLADDPAAPDDLLCEAVEVTQQRAAEEVARQERQMAAIGRMAGGLAHDFNNLLMGISGSLDRLQGYVNQSRMDGRAAAPERYINAARHAAQRAAALTHGLLAFARRQSLDARALDINVLCRGLEATLQQRLGDKIRLVTGYAPAPLIVSADAAQLENSIVGLALNASDAMPEGGTMTLQTELVVTAGDAASDMAAGDYGEIRVGDSGAGMSPEVAGRAFDPFFTTKPLGLGTGLGLSMIHGFVRQSGGHIRLESAPGTGTVIRIFLPLLASEDAAAEVTNGQSGGTVLIVDAQAGVRRLLAELVAGLGYAALQAGDGAAGTEILMSARTVDLVITDMTLPGELNGRQMADAGRKHRPGLKVIFLTGYADAARSNAALEPGMEVVAKPFSAEVLGRRIQALMPVGGAQALDRSAILAKEETTK